MNIAKKFVKKSFFLHILTIFILSSSINCSCYNVTSEDEILSNCSRYDIEGISFIIINGSFYEMGYQQGYLLKNEITKNMRAFEQYFNSKGIHYEDLLELWDKQKDFIPDKIIEFFQGMADSLDLSLERIGTVWVTEGYSYTMKCCGMAAWADATEDGELIALRSMEFPLDIKDPETADYIQETPVLVFAKPDEENSFIYPTFAGYSIEDGINEKGITISNNWSPSDENNDYGAPMGVRIFKTLYSANTAEEAVKIMTSNKTYGYNFIISDYKKPIGYAIETTVNYSYIGCWDNKTESNKPFTKIKDVVRRGNIFINKKTAEKQREIYNPRNLRSLLKLLIYKVEEPWYYVWANYDALSTGIETIWGEMNLNNTISMCREMYQGGYNHMWNILLKFIPKHSWWQWVVKPSTGEMYISFADADHCAYQTDLIKINYLETLENETPAIIE